MAPPRHLPRKWNGAYTDVRDLTDAERAARKLSSTTTIVEIVGWDQNGVRDGYDAVLAMVDWVRALPRPVVTVDTETAPKPEFADDPLASLDPYKGRIILVQVGNEDRQYLLWWETLSKAAQQLVLDLWSDPTVKKAVVNGKFDSKQFMGDAGLHVRPANLYDCQLIEQILACGLTGDIGFTMKVTGMGPMALRWLGLKLVKDEEVRTGWGNMIPGQWWKPRHECASDEEYEAQRQEGEIKRYYAADDCVIPIKLLRCQLPWIKELDLVDTMKLEMEFLPELAEMEMRGLPFDWAEWEVLAQEALEGYKKAQRDLDHLFNVEVTYRVDLDGNVEVTRDKNYGSKDELKDLIRTWMWEHEQVDVIGSNQQLKDSLARAGINPSRLEMLFEKKLVPNPEKPGSNMQVGYPRMADYIEGSEHAVSIYEKYRRKLPERHFTLTSTDSKVLKLMKILHETPDEEIDDIPEVPTKIGLPPVLVEPLLNLRKYGTLLQRYAYSWKDLIHPVTGRVHTSFTQTATDTGRLSSSPNCFDGETEVLTPRGWVSFSALRSDDLVAQFDPETDAISFVPPLAHIQYHYTGEMLHVQSEQAELLMTPDHRLLWETRKGRREFVAARNWVWDRKIFHAGRGTGGSVPLSADEVRLLVAIQADAHVAKTRVYFTFSKERKAARLHEILGALGIPYTATTSPLRCRFSVPRDRVEHLLHYLGEHKTFGWWVLELPRPVLDVFAEEIWLWDGLAARRTTYSSSDRANADIVQAAVLLSGRRANLRPYLAASGNMNWQVDASNRMYSWTTNATPVPVPYEGLVYCVTVPTGAIVVRRADEAGRVKATVVGNCQNLPADARYRAAVCRAPQGRKIVSCDWSQIEPRIIAEQSLARTYMRVFWSERPGTAGFAFWCGDSVTEPLDLYGGVGATIGVLPPDAEKKRIAKLPDNSKGRKKSKIGVLGLGYGQGKGKFFISFILDMGEYHPKSESDALVDGFWQAVPEIERTLANLSALADPENSTRTVWHPWTETTVTYSETLGKRKRFYALGAGGWWTQSRNQPVQGTGADLLKRTVIAVNKEYRKRQLDAFLLLTAHDELIGEAAESCAQEAADIMSYYMSRVGQRYCPHVPITAEASVADFWVKD